MLGLAAIMSAKNYTFVKDNHQNLNYIFPFGIDSNAKIFGESFASFYLAFNALVPLSMVMLIEIMKMI